MGEVPDALVEKAARNAWEHAQGDVVGFPWESLAPDEADAWRDDARKFLAAVWDDLPAAQPTVDRDALAEWFRDFHCNGEDYPLDVWREDADALLASGVLTDAAQVRADAAESALRKAAADAARMHDPVKPDCAEWADWLDARADRIAREHAASDREASDRG